MGRPPRGLRRAYRRGLALSLAYQQVLGKQRARDRSQQRTDWQGLANTVADACFPAQREFVMDPGRRVCALVGRGGGKTTGVRGRLLRRMMLTPRARCLFIALTRETARDLLWLPLKDSLERLGLLDSCHLEEVPLRCTFLENGSTVRLAGADDRKSIERFRGQPFHEVVIDEAASYDHQLLEHLIERVISPRLGDYGGALVLTGTPGHVLKGPFYAATRPGSDIARPWLDRDDPDYGNWTGWSHHAWTLRDGAPHVPALDRLWSEALIEKADKKWSDSHPVWMREYLGLWAADDTDHVFRYRIHNEAGELWNQWDPKKDAKGLAILPEQFKDWRHVIAMDTGYSDPTAVGVYAWSPTDPTKTLYHRYEFEKREMYARSIAILLLGESLNADKPDGLIGAIGTWPDAMVADAPEVLLDELSNVYGLKIERADKRTESRFASIELANGDLVDGRFKCLKGSRLEEQLTTIQWAHDDFGVPKKDKRVRDDQADQYIYGRRAAHHLFSQEAPAPSQGRSPYEQRAIQEGLPVKQDEFDDYVSDAPDDGGYWG